MPVPAKNKLQYASGGCFCLHVFWEAPDMIRAKAILDGLQQCALATKRDTPCVATYFFRISSDPNIIARAPRTIGEHPQLQAALKRISRGIPVAAVQAEVLKQGLDPALLSMDQASSLPTDMITDPVILEFTEVYLDERAFMEHSASKDFLSGYAEVMNPKNQKSVPKVLRLGTPAPSIVNMILQPVLRESVCPMVDGCSLWRGANTANEGANMAMFMSLDFATSDAVVTASSVAQVVAALPIEWKEQSSSFIAFAHPIHKNTVRVMATFPVLPLYSGWQIVATLQLQFGEVYVTTREGDSEETAVASIRNALNDLGLDSTVKVNAHEWKGYILHPSAAQLSPLAAAAATGTDLQDKQPVSPEDDDTPSIYFYVEENGGNVADAQIVFPEVKMEVHVDALHVPLRAVVRSFTSMKLANKISAKHVNYIYGRLSWFHKLVTEYNDGFVGSVSSEDLYYSRYIRYQLVQALSGLGYQIKDTNTRVYVPGIEDLMRKLRVMFYTDRLYYQSCIQDGVIVFDALQELYQPGVIVRGITSLGVPAGFRVVQAYYQERKSLFGFEQSFHLELQFVASMGSDFCVVQFESVLSRWHGEATKKISELFYAPADASLVDKWTTNGANYVALGLSGPKYLQHEAGSVLLRSSNRQQHTALPSAGRIMIDVAKASSLGHHAAQGSDDASYALSEITGRYKRYKAEMRSISGSDESGASGGSYPDSIFLLATVPQQLLAITWPALVGFSFTSKSWCTCLVSGLKPIEFNDSAFDELVLDPVRKRLIRALVRFGSGGEQLEDIIEGKSGGSIFLLHGPSGVGKTLTAEAIAEVLHKPLYYVTMGELGTDPTTMEQRLGEVLALCSGWGALTLIDEADVFLEKRVTSDIVRNAMTCVMLRLLEYHQGILFLTTNRVTEFDPALESRVTVALRYNELSESARAHVWRNMISRVPKQCTASTDIDYEQLAKYSLNGRQIKNSVRLAVALSLDAQKPLDQACLEETVAFTNMGRLEMQSAAKW